MANLLQVLILEDRPADAELMIQELVKAGYEPDWRRVETEQEFQKRLTPTLGLILMDHSLPRWSAFEALQLLHELKLDVPVVVVSGSIGEERAVECLKRGAVDYILKDRMARLGSAVKRALEDRRIRIEQAAANEAIRRREEQFRSIMATIEDVVWSQSLETGQLLYVNSAAEKLTGRSTSELLAAPKAWSTIVHPDDHAVLAQAQELAIRWGTNESEFRLVRPDGSLRSVLLRVWIAYDRSGKPQRIEGIFTDITDKRLAERERIELELARREATRLSGLNQFKSDLLNMVAHDLNNVLGPLKVNGFLLAKDERLTPERRAEVTQAFERGIRRMSEFLADLLDAARVQAGHLVVRASAYDLAARIRRAAEEHHPFAQGQDVRLHVEAPDSLFVEADERRIDQVLNNLIGNALKFTPAGGRVLVKAEMSDGSLVLSVEDTGQGLKADDLPNLFQAFARLGKSPQGKHTGTGLGLYICRGIIEAHGGKIWAESQGVGKGAAFRVSLPMHTVDPKRSP